MSDSEYNHVYEALMAYDGQEDVWPAAPLSFNFNSNEASLTTTTCDYITMDTMNQWQVSAMEDVDIVSGMPQASSVSESSGVSEESLGNSHMGDTHANRPCQSDGLLLSFPLTDARSPRETNECFPTTAEESPLTVDQLATTINTLTTLSQNLNSNIEGLNSSLGQMKVHLDRIELRLDNMEKRMGALDMRFKSLDDLLLEVIKREKDAMKQFSDLGYSGKDM